MIWPQPARAKIVHKCCNDTSETKLYSYFSYQIPKENTVSPDLTSACASASNAPDTKIYYTNAWTIPVRRNHMVILATRFWKKIRFPRMISYAKTYSKHLGFNQHYWTFTLELPMNIVPCGKFPSTKFTNYKFSEMRSHLSLRQREQCPEPRLD